MMGNLYYELKVHRGVSDNLQLIKLYTFSVNSKKRCTMTLINIYHNPVFCPFVMTLAIYYSDTGQVRHSDP